jgi:2,5-furandicarboxylate decarboxylase 1
VVQVTAVSHRERPIFHTIVPAGYEHLLLGAIPREASLLENLRRRFPGVRAVHLTPGGTCRYHEHVLVVDADVDVFDHEEVEWALATRFQGNRDLVVVPGAQASSLDPSSENGLGAKVGFDCTVPPGADPSRYLRIAIPGYDAIRAEDYVARHAQEVFE